MSTEAGQLQAEGEVSYGKRLASTSPSTLASFPLAALTTDPSLRHLQLLWHAFLLPSFPLGPVLTSPCCPLRAF